MAAIAMDSTKVVILDIRCVSCICPTTVKTLNPKHCSCMSPC